MDTTESTFRSNIANLFDSNKEFEEFLKVVTNDGVILEKHPFGLSANKYPDMCDIILVSYPGYTDSSVDGMKAVLRCAMSRSAPTAPIRLRIIRAQHERDTSRPNGYNHWLWFETSWYQGTFICGGCNDFSGGGGAGGRTLESLFMALTEFDDVTLEEVIIPLEKAAAAKKCIFEAHDQNSKERSAA